MGSVPHLPTGETFATMYAPLEKAPFTPQVIIIVARPWAMLKLAQSSLFRMGGRAHADFSGIQSVCSDSAAETYLTGKPNFSLGCDGSRTFSGITDDEMVMGFPAEMLPESCGRPAGCRQGARVVEEIVHILFFREGWAFPPALVIFFSPPNSGGGETGAPAGSVPRSRPLNSARQSASADPRRSAHPRSRTKEDRRACALTGEASKTKGEYGYRLMVVTCVPRPGRSPGDVNPNPEPCRAP